MSVKNKATMIKYSGAEDGCFSLAIKGRNLILQKRMFSHTIENCGDDPGEKMRPGRRVPIPVELAGPLRSSYSTQEADISGKSCAH